MYKTTCKVCKSEGQETAYIGESSRTLHERTAEHLKDYINNRELTHMTTHMAERHPTLPHPADAKSVAKVFEVQILKKHRTAMNRQIHEAIMIGKAGGCLLNSKEEYTRCTIPELSTTNPQPTKSTPTPEIDNHMKRSRDSSTQRSRKRPRKETDTEIMPPPPSRQAPSKSNRPAQGNPLTIKEMIRRMKRNPTPPPELPEPAREQEPQVVAGTKVQEPSPNPEPTELPEQEPEPA